MSNSFILIVEDNFIIAEATCRMLESAGDRVAMARSAEAALAFARKTPRTWRSWT